MSKKITIAVVTGSRSDYGLLKTLIFLIKKHPLCKLKLIVTGSHLSPVHGMTVNKIVEDNLYVDAKIEILFSSDTNVGMAKSLGLATLSFTEILSLDKPDLVVLLGDRYEILAAAQAAYCLKIPIAHLHGGEVTAGALDDSFRHAISKFSHLHFVSHYKYRERLMQLGERPNNIYICGAPGLDLIPETTILKRKEFCARYKLDHEKEFASVNFHPSTLDKIDNTLAIDRLFNVLYKQKDLQLLVTLANSDPAGYAINERWHHYAKKYPEKIQLSINLGNDLYFNAIYHSKFVIGNSSSGILEVPYFNKPTINVGVRQVGRIAPNSVINCSYSEKEINNAVMLAQDRKWVNKNVLKGEKIYGIPGKISQKILKVLLIADLSNIIYKQFWDLDHDTK